ncbi:MAG: hypothetical protein KBF58_09390 [Methyloversatilis sp.]|nr:hypothetical protein [Methyloversatilis sp.]
MLQLIALTAFSFVSIPKLAMAQEAPKQAPSFWDQIKEGVSKGVEQATGGDVVGKIKGDVANNLEGKTPQGIGYVDLGNGQYLTFFEGDPRGFPSADRPLTAKPAPGAAGSKVPAFVTVPVNVKNGRSTEGVLVGNNIDEMRKNNLLVAFAASGEAPPSPTETLTPMRAPTVAVQEAIDANGNIVRNHPNNCRIILVYDASGKVVRERPLRTDLDFNMAGVCQDKTFAMQRKGIRDAAPATPPK